MRVTTLLLLATALLAQAGDFHLGRCHAERTCTVSNRTYQVNYDYDNSRFWQPLVIGNSKAHYDAAINVFLCVETNILARVSKEFGGTYVDGGCFEDKPEDLVVKAYALANEPPAPAYDLTNGVVTVFSTNLALYSLTNVEWEVITNIHGVNIVDLDKSDDLLRVELHRAGDEPKVLYLHWDGESLEVSDSNKRRVLSYSP